MLPITKVCCRTKFLIRILELLLLLVGHGARSHLGLDLVMATALAWLGYQQFLMLLKLKSSAGKNQQS